MQDQTILVTNNNPASLTELTKALDSAGCNVIRTKTPDELAQLAEQHHPDLVVLDIATFPNLNIEKAHQLRDEIGIDTLFLNTDNGPPEFSIQNGTLACLANHSEHGQLIATIKNTLRCSKELRRLKANEGKMSEAIKTNRDISVAIGIYMEHYHTSEVEAFEKLRAHARNERKRLIDIAHELITATEQKNVLIKRIHNRSL